jgi:hypothetical protein
MLRQLWQNLCGTTAARQPHSGRRRPPRLEALEDRCVPAVTYHGGPLLTSARVENYFYGPSWNAEPNQGRLNAFSATLLKSPFMTEMTELGYSVGRGALDAAFTTGRDPGGTLTDSQVRAALQADITAGLIRSPDSQRLYVVYAPAGAVVIDPLGDSSLQGLLGYHYSFAGRDAAGNPATIYYAVIAYPGSATNNLFAPGTATAFDSLTVVTSHEVAEAVTDPAVNTSPAWYDGSTGQEIADIGQNAAPARMLGYSVTLLGAQNDALAAPPTFTAAQFGPSGLWRYSSLRGWVELSGATATAVATDPAGDVVASFGPSGLWKYTEETGWAELRGANAVAVAIDHAGDVAASFGPSGLWYFNVGTGWAEISAANANLVAMDYAGDVAAGFGAAGLWKDFVGYGWVELSAANATSLG